MSKNIFKIYDGRTSFWQWDTGQKLIVLDENVTEVHFSNKNMEHAKRKIVYTDESGQRVCNIPDILLQLPKNLIAYAYASDGNGTGRTVKSVKFGIVQRPIPANYICNQDEALDDITARLELLEALIKDVDAGNQNFIKFESMVDAAKWAVAEGEAGTIVVIHLEGKWIAHIVEDDKSLSPICDDNGQMVEVKIFDGGDADGYTPEEQIEVMIWDGGSAAGY